MDAFNLTYDEALAELTSGKPMRRYGICSARGLLHAALCQGRVHDEYPPNDNDHRPAVEIRVQRGTASKPDRYWIRDITITRIR